MSAPVADDLVRCLDTCGERALRLARGLGWSAEEAPDLVQQAFVVAVERRDAIPADDPWPWFARVLVNVSRNARRRRARPVEAAAPVELEPVDERGPDPAEVADHAEQLERLERALLRLPEDEREAVLLTHVSGLTHRAAAATLELSRETVTSRVQRGLERLRRALGVRSAAAAAVLLAGGFAGLRVERGARGAWLAAIGRGAGAGGAPAVVGGALGTGVAVTGKTLIGAVLVAVAATWVVARGANERGTLPSPPSPSARRAPAVAPGSGPPAPVVTAAAVQDPAQASELAAARARIAALEAELSRERARANAAARPPTVAERVQALRAIADPGDRSTAGWRLGEVLGDEAGGPDALLELLLTADDPDTLDALSLVLRSGPLSDWRGERQAELIAALEREPPVRRRCAAAVLTRFLRRATAPLGDKVPDLDPAEVSAPRAALIAALRRGDDAVVSAFSEEFAAFSCAPQPAEAQALWAAVDAVRTHEARVSALRAIARASLWLEPEAGLGERSLIARWERDPSPPLRAAIVDALTSVWRQRSSNEPASEAALLERWLPETREVERRRRLIHAWAGHAEFPRDLPLLRALGEREPDAELRGQVLGLVERLTRSRAFGSDDLDRAFWPR